MPAVESKWLGQQGFQFLCTQNKRNGVNDDRQLDCVPRFELPKDNTKKRRLETACGTVRYFTDYSGYYLAGRHLVRVLTGSSCPGLQAVPRTNLRTRVI